MNRLFPSGTIALYSADGTIWRLLPTRPSLIGARLDQAQQPGLKPVQMGASACFEAYEAWCARQKLGLDVGEQRERRFPRLVRPVGQIRREMQHHRLGHGKFRHKPFQQFVGRHLRSLLSLGARLLRGARP